MEGEKKKRKNRKNNDDGSAKEEEDDPPGITNLEDDTTNIWHHHYQVSQDQMRATKRLQLIRICKQLRTAASERRAMKGLKLTARSYGLQHQKGEK